jgi:hypothetical protein
MKPSAVCCACAACLVEVFRARLRPPASRRSVGSMWSICPHVSPSARTPATVTWLNPTFFATERSDRAGFDFSSSAAIALRWSGVRWRRWMLALTT